MTMLAGKSYDPAVAVAKSTAAVLAMTALDTVNLRLEFIVPSNGQVMVRMSTVISGGTVFPQVLLGVLEGSVVRGRCSPVQVMGGTALATTFLDLGALFLVTGLTPGASLSWDAAYGVETLAASSNLRYGGPNDASANNAWGGFGFEIWDVL